MGQIESYSWSDPGGANKSIATRSGTSWVIGTLTMTPEELHGVKGAMAAAMAQSPGTTKFYAKVFDTHAGPDVTYNAGDVAVPADDTAVLPAQTPWSRAKVEDFIASTDLYAPLPPAP